MESKMKVPSKGMAMTQFGVYREYGGPRFFPPVTAYTYELQPCGFNTFTGIALKKRGPQCSEW
jgi:hypothetical protein